MKRVVSVSLGSSSRDHRSEIDLLGERIALERVGMDGSLARALKKLEELDGRVDAIGLGGIDVYLYAGAKRYALRDGLRLLEAVKRTPVVDGSGLKNTLERQAVRYLTEELGVPLRGDPVLMVSALDRFGMAQALVAAGADVLFGDFIFALDLDKPVRGLAEFEGLAERYLARRLQACRSNSSIRPARSKTARRSRSIRSTMTRRDIIAGDFHFMRQFMPDAWTGNSS